MIFLNSVFDPTRATAARDELSAIRLPHLLSSLEEIWEAAGDRNANVDLSLDYAYDSDADVYYESFRTQVTGRMIKNRRRYLLGSGFAVDFDSVLDMFFETYAYYDLS